MEITSTYNMGIEALSNFIEHVVSWEIRDFPGVSAMAHLEGTMVRVPGTSESLYFYPTTPQRIRACRISSAGKISEHLGEYVDYGTLPGSTHDFMANLISEELNAADTAA